MNQWKTLLWVGWLVCGLAGRAPAVILPQVFDPLDDTSHFIDATLTLTDNGNGTVSLTHNAAGDEVAHWGKDGADERIVYSAPRLEVVTVAAIDSGQWGFDIQWFNGAGTYLGQTLFQAATSGTGLFSYVVSGAPTGTVSWRPQFRVFDSGGTQGAGSYGFTFDQINAYQVPEPSVLALVVAGTGLWIFRRRAAARR